MQYRFSKMIINHHFLLKKKKTSPEKCVIIVLIKGMEHDCEKENSSKKLAIAI